MKLPPEKIYAWVTSNFDVKERKGGEELRICNPFDGDRKYHLNISIKKALTHDFRGDDWAGYTPGGNLAKRTFLKFVQLYLNCSYTQAVKEVLGSSSSARRFLRHRKLKGEEEATKDLSFGLPSGAESLLTPKQPKAAATVLRWLISRGIDKRKIEKYGIMHAGLDVVWPYFEFDELVYWQSRSRTDKRFLFPDLTVGVGKGDFLYGFDQVEPASYLIITEAIFDCQTLEHQCVASGGADLSDRQLRKIKFLGPRDGIILAPDNDVPGVKSILANAQRLDALGFKLFFSIPPEIEYVKDDGMMDVTKDWNDLVAKVEEVDPFKIMEENVRPLGVRERYKLRAVISAGARR